MSKNKVKSKANKRNKQNGKRKAKRAKIAKQEHQKKLLANRKTYIDLAPEVKTKKEDHVEPLSQDLQKQILGARRRGTGASAAKSTVAKMVNATSKPEHKAQDN